MRNVHPLLVLAAFTLATLVVHVLVMAALRATSVLPRETSEDDPTHDRRPHVPR